MKTQLSLHEEFAQYIEREQKQPKSRKQGQRNAQRRAKQAQRVRYLDSY